MVVSIGTALPSKISIGSTEVLKISIGTTEVWSASTGGGSDPGPIFGVTSSSMSKSGNQTITDGTPKLVSGWVRTAGFDSTVIRSSRLVVSGTGPAKVSVSVRLSNAGYNPSKIILRQNSDIVQEYSFAAFATSLSFTRNLDVTDQDTIYLTCYRSSGENTLTATGTSLRIDPVSGG